MHFTISDMVLDIAQNSIEAGSSLIVIDYLADKSYLRIYIADNGRGMDEETLSKALDPFYTDGEKHIDRHVGLGLPFLKQMSESTGGKFDIQSVPGEGTSIFIELLTDHIDCPPEGDLTGLISQLMLFDGEYELAVNRSFFAKRYSITRGELKESLGDLFDAQSIKLAQDYIKGCEEVLKD